MAVKSGLSLLNELCDQLGLPTTVYELTLEAAVDDVANLTVKMRVTIDDAKMVEEVMERYELERKVLPRGA